MAARMLAGSMQHRRGGTIPGPCRGRQSCRILESGLLHPPQAALFPPFSLFGCAKKHEAPTKSADFVGRGGAKERSGVLAEGGDGVEWISPRRRAVHGPKEKNRLKLNIRGIPIRGRAESHRAVLPIYLPATGALYCFAAGDEGVVHLSHAFLGHLLKPRLLLVLSSPVFRLPQDIPRLSSFVPRLQGECSRGDRSPLLIRGGARERAESSPEAAGRRRGCSLADFATPHVHLSHAFLGSLLESHLLLVSLFRFFVLEGINIQLREVQKFRQGQIEGVGKLV